MSKTTKTLEIKVLTDEAERKLKKLEEQNESVMLHFKDTFKLSDEEVKSISNAADAYKKVVKQQEYYNELKRKEADLKKLIKTADDKDKASLRNIMKESQDTRKQMLKKGEAKDPDLEKSEEAIKKKTMANLTKSLKKFEKDAIQVWNTLGINLKSVFGDVVQELSKMLDPYKGMASYGLGTSLFTNAAAREQAMKYGLSDAQNYALTQTMSMLGMSSDNDLMYMNSAQKEKFNRLMDQYNNWYTKMSATGLLENIQEAQLEFKILKQEISYKLLNWFAKNKDRIMTALQVIMKAVEVIANVILSILNILSFGGSNRYSSGVEASVVSSTGGVVNNVNVNNTNNATAMLNNKEELQSSFEKSNANLVKQIGAAILAKR